VRGGKDLSQALAAFPRVFPDIYVNMIKAGEASGQLDIVLSRLADYQEAASALRSEIKSAMTYPIVSLVLVIGISAFLLVFIIPKFQEMFYTMNVELPAITIGLLELSSFLKENILIWSGGLVAAFFALRAFLKTDRGKWIRDWLFLHLPVFGALFSKVAISRFSRTFATLIQSGVPILGALDIVAQTAGNRIIAAAVRRASESVKQGETLGEPLAQSKVFPPMVTRMISIGEKTGALEQLLEKISDFYDQQVKTTVDKLTSLIEPIMIATMGVVVGGMVLAIFLPIFKMVGSLGG
jgi:type IV pilus assembly protein PilC